MTYFFETYGCQMNSAESAALESQLRDRGWKRAGEGTNGEAGAGANGVEADLVILNTCSVRNTAETRLRGRLAHYQARKRDQSRFRPFTLLVAGCMASRLGERLKVEFPAVDWVLGTSEYGAFPGIIEALEKQTAAVTGAAVPGTVTGAAPDTAVVETGEAGAEAGGRSRPAVSFASSHLEAGAFRSFVPIMHGCDNFCSYCIVPYVRGAEVSRSPAAIEEEIRLAADRGIREITLLGQNVNSYRFAGGGTGGAALDFPGLLRLIARAVQGSPVEWVRFLSANPKDLSPQTVAVMAEHPVFCRHLHLPVQHGSDRILAAMNRRYTRRDYLALTGELRRAMPDLSLSTDILVGFPGETEADLEETLALMEEVRFLYAYMYHYNPREGTAAAALPGRIPEKVKRERLGRVIALQKKHGARLLRSRLGSRCRILVEGISRKNADEVVGRTERDEMAVLPGGPDLAGTFVEVSLESLRGNTFRARPSGAGEKPPHTV